ncbi:MAG: YfbR-like 5'-deoxynucleotidase [Candidatus Methanomethylophilaceae archaeon]|jgi:putative hydrolase of HD superfamily
MKKNLNSEMLYFMFESANMHRWNDHLRPLNLTEQDKQAHKAAVIWVLGKYDEDDGNEIDWKTMIEHSVFEFISRMVLTDLKPQLYHQIMSDNSEQANKYVFNEFKRRVPNMNPEFCDRLKAYLQSGEASREDCIVEAAHYLATKWEFDVIYKTNTGMFNIEETKDNIDGEVSKHLGLQGVVKALTDKGTKNFIDKFGQLRFQQRWTRTPRIPQTTVLGHSLMVANAIFLHNLDVGASDEQIYNDYYAALFHDLPEVLTKDVISPVKINVEGLADMLGEIEKKLMESEILPLLPESWRDEMEFMFNDPFGNVDNPRFGKRRGSAIKSCDLLCAYVEAYVSICYGISPHSLKEGAEDLRAKLKETGSDINAAELIKSFEELKI